MIPIDTIICGDCLEVMKEIPDESIDLVLTDPLYGVGITKNDTVGGTDSRTKLAKMTVYGKSNWDNNRPSEKCLTLGLRRAKREVPIL